MATKLPPLRSRPLDSEAARRLVVDLEHSGLDGHLISIEADPPSGPAQTGSADGETMTRPGSRVGVGLGVGLAVGLVAGAILGSISDVDLAAALVAGAIVGLALGGLAGLYSRLNMHRELVDVSGPGLSTVIVDPTELDDETVGQVASLIDRA